MKRKVFLTLIVLSILTVATAALNSCGLLPNIIIGSISSKDPLIYEKTADGYAVVDCDSEATNVTIPVKYNGKPVTSIGDYAFENCDSLTSIKYRGTSSQWNAISKGYNWDYNTGYYAITYNYNGE